MTSLIQDYEQQYAVLSAEITSDIGKISRLSGGINLCSINRSKETPYGSLSNFLLSIFLINSAERRELVAKINSSLEEVQELVNKL